MKESILYAANWAQHASPLRVISTRIQQGLCIVLLAAITCF
jgi:hypothetical protein